VDRKLAALSSVALAMLAMSACHERRAPGRTTASPPAPPAASGPVNPDPGVTTYACVDGQRVTAGYPDAETAVVTYKDHAYTLKLTRSAQGARYTGYGLQWWIQGVHANLATLKADEEIASESGLECSAEGASSAASVTHISYEPAQVIWP
jgi:membrane-bound inhibitor of C-type lysozyme